MRYATTISLGVAAALAACVPDYIHVFVESSSRELSSASNRVEVVVFGDGRDAHHEFSAQFEPPAPGVARTNYTDFNLVLDDDVDTIDLRIGITSLSTRWSATSRFASPSGGNELHVVLYPGSIALGPGRILGGEAAAIVAYSTGLAMAWVNDDGVQRRIERVPERPINRAVPIITDAAAGHVRLASASASSPFGPDRLCLAARGGDGTGRLVLEDSNHRTPPISLGSIDDLLVACLPDPVRFAAVLTRSDDTGTLTWHNATGATIDSITISGLREVRALAGVNEHAIGALRTTDGWRLVRWTNGAITGERSVASEILAMSITEEKDLVITVERRDRELVVQRYYVAGLEPLGEATAFAKVDRLPADVFVSLGMSSCAVAWPELRDDRSGAVDIWVLNLDVLGVPTGSSRVLNGTWMGSHIAPQLVCLSQARAYAVFAEVGDDLGQDGALQLRHVPPTSQ